MTRRQQQVMDLLDAGTGVEAAARSLGVSAAAVRDARRRARRKLGRPAVHEAVETPEQAVARISGDVAVGLRCPRCWLTLQLGDRCDCRDFATRRPVDTNDVGGNKWGGFLMTGGG